MAKSPASVLERHEDLEEESQASLDEEEEDEEDEEEAPLAPLNGLGRARSSALALGCPPCLSGNVLAAFCTSFIYGDDIVCRTTENSISRLEKRVERTSSGGFIGKKLGFMSDTLSLTVSSLQTHAHGSEGEEIINFIENNDLVPIAIYNTHGHYDHIGAVHDLKLKYDIKFFCISSSVNSKFSA